MNIDSMRWRETVPTLAHALSKGLDLEPVERLLKYTDLVKITELLSKKYTILRALW
jgi:hypothetical protein